MPNAPQAHAEWQAEHHRAAQEAAVEWATKADASANAALKSETYIKDRQGSDYMRQAVADERVVAQEHSARSAHARQLAEMWARVALALTPEQAPANGEPATYDVRFDFDAAAVGQEVERQLKKLRQQPGSG